MQPVFTELHEEEISYSVGAHESLTKNTYLAWNVVVDALDNKRNLALDILDYVLLSSPGAPLKQALVEAGIGDDIFGGFEDGIRQPYFSVCAKGADAKDKKRFLSIIDTTLRKLVHSERRWLQWFRLTVENVTKKYICVEDIKHSH